MKYPEDCPRWLQEIVEELDSDAVRFMGTEEPARAVGFFTAVQKLKDAISSQAEAVEARRKRELHELTFPQPSN